VVGPGQLDKYYNSRYNGNRSYNGAVLVTTLDIVASRAVYAARLFERAVNDDGPWYIEYAGVRFPAHKSFDQTRVLFTVKAPPLPFEEGAVVALYCRDELLSVQQSQDIGFVGFIQIEWALELNPVA